MGDAVEKCFMGFTTQLVWQSGVFHLQHCHFAIRTHNESQGCAHPFGHCQCQPSYGDQLWVYWLGLSVGHSR